MKVTKFPQSCFVIEDRGQRLLIDLGTVALESFTLEQIGRVSAVLYTHQHFDHFEAKVLDELVKMGAKLYANADVANLIGDRANLVKHGQVFETAGFSIQPHDLPHCKMQDGSDGPPNTGYIVDGHFFHPGDGIDTEGVHVSHLALPIAGPTINLENATAFAKKVGAKKIIPMHYDVFKADPREFASSYHDGEVIVLGPGQSAEL